MAAVGGEPRADRLSRKTRRYRTRLLLVLESLYRGHPIYGRTVQRGGVGTVGAGHRLALERGQGRQQALVRDITDVEPGALVFLDNPSSTFGRFFKCIIVGSSKGRARTRARRIMH